MNYPPSIVLHHMVYPYKKIFTKILNLKVMYTDFLVFTVSSIYQIKKVQSWGIRKWINPWKKLTLIK